MKTLISVLCVSFVFTLISGRIVIPLLRKIKAKQTILKYVETHKEKNGTPTMGGLFFIVPTVIVYFVFCGLKSRMATVSVAIGLAFMAVGFLDDFLKIKLKQNEGLKAYQKIIFQTAIAFVAGFFAYNNGLTKFYLPFTKLSVDFSWVTVPFVALIFIAITNCVNLTDGLDGLAGSTSVVYLVIFVALISVQGTLFDYAVVKRQEYYSLKVLSCALIGSVLAFLVYNQNKASVFMGDTGSLSLGGFLGCISIFSSNSLFIPIVGIMFVLSGISVIMQVAYYKRTKKRIFLMAPLHHHFQLKGYSETKITYCYSLLTALLGVVCLLIYM